MIGRAVWAAAFVVAAVAALAPLPAPLVERWYSRGLFPLLQRVLTSASNAVPFALFDVIWIGGVAAVVLIAYRRIRAHGWRAGCDPRCRHAGVWRGGRSISRFSPPGA